MAGQPFAANPLNKTAYPPQWLVILLPPALHLNVMITIHLLLAGWGMVRWAQSLGLRREAVLLSAVAYILAPRIVAHLSAGHLDIIYAMAWWPWLMLMARRALIQERHTLFNMTCLGLSAGLLFLADVRVSLFAFGAAGVYIFIHLSNIGEWRRLARFAIPLILLILLTISLTLPLLSWREYTNRGDLRVDEAGTLALEPLHLLGLILPAHEGSVETLTYLGLPVMVLGVIGIASMRVRYRWLSIVAAIFIFMYALGGNGVLWPVLADNLAFLRWFRVPSRIWLIPTLLVPILAGHGLQQVLVWGDAVREKQVLPALKRVRLLIAATMLVVIITGIFALSFLPLPASTGLSALVNGTMLAAILLSALAGRLSSRHVVWLIMGIIFLDLMWTGTHWLEWRGKDVWLEPYRVLAERLVEDEPHRIYSPAYSLQQQVAEEYDLQLFGGVDPFQLTGIVDAIEQGSGVPITVYSPVVPPLNVVDENNLNLANRDATINTQTLAQWDVSHIVAPYTIDHERLQLLDTVNSVLIYRNLDYDTTAVSREHVPNWPEDWPRLPDVETVQSLNRMMTIVTIISFVIFAFTVIYLARETYQRHVYQ